MIEVVYDVTVANMIYIGRTAVQAIALRKRFPFATIKARKLKACEKRPVA